MRFMNMYGPVVNLNGENRDSLIKKHVAVATAADALMTALGDMCPHGRDYQTAPDQIVYKLDRAIWEAMLGSADDIRKTYLRIAERLVTEE